MNDQTHNKYFDLTYMDTLSQGESILHKMDPRILLVTSLAFLFIVISFDKYVIAPLIPFFLYPVFLLMIGELPLFYFLKKIIVISPFILFFVILNPFFDRQTVMQIGSFSLSGGMISSFSILLRFILTVSTGLILMSLIGIHGICLGLEKLYVPKTFVTQILLLYRYLFILTEELSKMMLAKSLRQFGHHQMKFETYISILGHLFLRSLDRAERVYLSMCARGFKCQFFLNKKMTITRNEVLFFTSWTFFFILFRFFNIPLFIGNLLTK